MLRVPICAVALSATAIVICSSAWLVRRARAGPRSLAVLLLSVAMLLLPAVFPYPHWEWRCLLAIVLVVLCCKLYDAHVGADHWQQACFREWARFLVAPHVLVWRRQALAKRVPFLRALTQLGRGLLEVLAGGGILYWAMHEEFGRHSFWLEHGVKLVASYVCLFDGLFITITGAVRVLGGRCLALNDEPILARTPAEFWRRYNRWFGQFFFEDVFRRVGGLRTPWRGIACVFLLNGLLHEYLVWAMIGRVSGYPFAFFALHGVAVAATFAARPKGWWALAGVAGTIVFHFFSSVLIFTAFQEVLGNWYLRSPF